MSVDVYIDDGAEDEAADNEGGAGGGVAEDHLAGAEEKGVDHGHPEEPVGQVE